MTKIRVQDAMDFHNAKNHEMKITRATLGSLLYPKSSIEAIRVNMGELINGTKQKVNPDWIVKICQITGVDANFLLGMDSIFDKEFEELTSKK